MALPNLDALLKASHGDLMRLRHDVITAIAQTEKENKRKAREELEARAKELGFSASDLFGTSSVPKGKAPKSETAPKYRHPEFPDSDKTWSGRGRQPDWIKSYLESGKSLDDLLID